MSQIATVMEEKGVKRRSDWTDLNRDGQRLEKTLKMLYTRINPDPRRKNIPEPLSEEMMLSFIHTIIKVTHEKRGIVDTVLGVNTLLKEMKVK